MDEMIISFQITRAQALKIAEHFKRELNDCEEYEICEMLDRIIDEI